MNRQDYDASNFMRILTMLEKTIDRLIRRNYYNQSQWPDIIFQIKEAIDLIRSWIKIYKPFSDCKNYVKARLVAVNLNRNQIAVLVDVVSERCSVAFAFS